MGVKEKIMDITTIIIGLLIVLLIGYTAFFAYDLIKHKDEFEGDTSWWKTGAIGALVNFFDPLGIGAFAPQTALLKFTKQTRDKLIPGTMNVANCIPVLLQALIFTTVVKVEAWTLVVMLAAAMLGAVLGAGVVSRMSEKKIRLVMYSMHYAGKPLEFDADRWRRHWFGRWKTGNCRYCQLHSGGIDDSRCRPVQPLYGTGVSAGNVTGCGISNHDGLLCLSDAACICEVY